VESFCGGLPDAIERSSFGFAGEAAIQASGAEFLIEKEFGIVTQSIYKAYLTLRL
jgi:hypothetical protein